MLTRTTSCQLSLTNLPLMQAAKLALQQKNDDNVLLVAQCLAAFTDLPEVTAMGLPQP